MANKTFVTVPFERIQRVIDILSMVSIGEYTTELTHIPPSEVADEFSVLEAALNIYNQELAAARAQNERYIAELEQSKLELQEQLTTIARQQLAIHELSSPIVEVWEDILLLPVIGSLDSQRAQEMTEKLLERIKTSRSRCVIIDITAVEGIDTATAGAVLKMTRASRLLGAICLLTGVRPEIARTMVQLNIDVEGVRTMRSLREGLRHCFEILKRARELRLARRRAEEARRKAKRQAAEAHDAEAAGQTDEIPFASSHSHPELAALAGTQGRKNLSGLSASAFSDGSDDGPTLTLGALAKSHADGTGRSGGGATGNG
jgi:rsbT co-antagonist protein RsbR